MRLTRQQRDEAFEAIAAIGFSPRDFVLKEDSEISLTHKPSGWWFLIQDDTFWPFGKTPRYKPTWTNGEPVKTTWGKPWLDIVPEIKRWLEDLKQVLASADRWSAQDDRTESGSAKIYSAFTANTFDNGDTGEPMTPVSVPAAMICWAHGDETWQGTVARFAFKLRELGVDADVDLFHLHDPNVDWTTYGPKAIEDREWVLVAVSRAFKERWEGRADPRTGAGAAREANVLKALFDANRQSFARKVKVIVLPGASLDDIPTELAATAQRFKIDTIDGAGLEDLLRTLARRPAYIPPQVGILPTLPPKVVNNRERAKKVSAIPSESVAEAIANLPEREKLVITLTYYENLTPEEIAEILGTSTDEVDRLKRVGEERLDGH